MMKLSFLVFFLFSVNAVADTSISFIYKERLSFLTQTPKLGLDFNLDKEIKGLYIRSDTQFAYSSNYVTETFFSQDIRLGHKFKLGSFSLVPFLALGLVRESFAYDDLKGNELDFNLGLGGILKRQLTESLAYTLIPTYYRNQTNSITTPSWRGGVYKRPRNSFSIFKFDADFEIAPLPNKNQILVLGFSRSVESKTEYNRKNSEITLKLGVLSRY